LAQLKKLKYIDVDINDFDYTTNQFEHLTHYLKAHRALKSISISDTRQNFQRKKPHLKNFEEFAQRAGPCLQALSLVMPHKLEKYGCRKLAEVFQAQA